MYLVRFIQVFVIPTCIEVFTTLIEELPSGTQRLVAYLFQGKDGKTLSGLHKLAENIGKLSNYTINFVRYRKIHFLH